MTARPAHYGAADLRAALAALPLARGDVLFLHANIGFFGRAEGAADAPALCRLFLEALQERVGPEGTLVVPAFTYSFPRRQVFDPAHSSAADMGTFAEWLRQQPGAHRSVDPCYSVAALGAQAEALTRDAPVNSFGKHSFFARFAAADGVILNLNFDAGSTFLHYLERERRVPYRFDKTFEGFIEQNGAKRQARSTIHVRYGSTDATEAVFEPFHRVAVEAGLFHATTLGRGRLGCIRAGDCARLLSDTLPTRPWLLTRADALGAMPALEPEPDYQPLPRTE